MDNSRKLLFPAVFMRRIALDISSVVLLILLCIQIHKTDGVCAAFPHSHLFCGQFINDTAVVYTDPNVYNYTKLNNVVETLFHAKTFDVGDTSSLCPWITSYLICQSFYPQCNSTTEELLPVCMDSCDQYYDTCVFALSALTVYALRNDPSILLFALNCSHQLRAFSSVNIDNESCHDFYLAPMFVTSTVFVASDTMLIRYISLADPTTYTPYCSELDSRALIVTCRAVGIPQPRIDIFGKNTTGNVTLNEILRHEELIVRIRSIYSGDVVWFQCLASTSVITVEIQVNLTYTCCTDDMDMQHSIGQQFMTSDCRQCLCGDGGNISCNQPGCESISNKSRISSGIIAVIVVIVILAIAIIVVIVVFVWRLVQKRNKKLEIFLSNPMSTEMTSDSGKVLLSALDVPTFQPFNSITINDETDINDNNCYDEKFSKQCVTDEKKNTPTHPTDKHSDALKSLLSENDEDFKLTKELITTAMINRQLNNFLKPFECLTILKTLGEGAFGKVFLGEFTNEIDQSVTEVAVKTMKDCRSMEELDVFIAESVIMKDFKHRNVLGLVGVSVGLDNEIATPYIILPFMANGDLKEYLKAKRRKAGKDLDLLFKEINYLTLVKMCTDISQGMEYLAKIRFVHRDLAARNCMIGKDLVVKVADFGLSRDIYSNDYYRMGQKGKVPIKWMPPESIHDRYYDEKTDVWAFGVVCWEVFSLGKLPYAGVDNQNLPQHIEFGKRLSKPALCSDQMYQIMLSCWDMKSSDRPFFSTLAEQLEQHYSDVLESDTSNPSSPYQNLFTKSAYENWKTEETI